MRLWPGVLYGSLRQMVVEGLIEEAGPPPQSPDDNVERRYYRITPVGRRRLANEASRLREYVKAAESKSVFDHPEVV